MIGRQALAALVAAFSVWSLLGATSISAQQTDSYVFEVSALNPQLGSPPDRLDRSTPRATVEGLLDAIASGQPERAAHFLDVSEDIGVTSPLVAALRAEQLATVIERSIRLNWPTITDRPDGLLDTAPSDQTLAGEPRRSVLLGRAKLGPNGVPIRVDRVQPASGPPVWVFSSRTVERIPELYAKYGPREFELLLPDRLRQEAVFGLMWWELLALPVAISLILCAGAITWVLVGRAGRGSTMMARIVSASQTPLAILIATLVAATLIAQFFAFSAEISHIARPMIATGFALAILLFVFRSFEVVIERFGVFDEDALRDSSKTRKRVIATRLSALRRALLIGIALIAGFVALHEAQLSGGIGMSLAASAGLLTLLVAFLGRATLANVFASMQIALNQSARIGDKVLYDGKLCHVERIHLTFVQLRVWTGIRLIVPVNEFVAEPFENWTLQEQFMVRLIPLRLAHTADIDALREDFGKIMDDLDTDELGDREEAFVMVTDQDALGIEVTFGLPCSNPDTAWRMSCRARERLMQAIQTREETGATFLREVSAMEAA